MERTVVIIKDLRKGAEVNPRGVTENINSIMKSKSQLAPTKMR
jgi:hypothetical protein